MSRWLALTALLFNLTAFADEQEDNAAQVCEGHCSQAMVPCVEACTGGNPDDAMNAKNQTKTMNCAKKCMDAQKPCRKACHPPKKKK